MGLQRPALPRVPGPSRVGGQAGRRAGSEESGACSSFKLFLELEPQVRDIIFKFYESKYASCLKMLDEMKVRGQAGGGAFSRLRRGGQPSSPALPPGQPAPGHVPGSARQDAVHADPQPGPHPGKPGPGAGAGAGGGRPRGRALLTAPALQYFSPYVSADMRKMATAFNTTVAALEDELTQLILEGLINARIDSHSKVAGLRPGCGAGDPGPADPCAPTDPVRPGRGPAQHHLREVPADGQGVPAPRQSHDPAGGCAAQPDPRQGGAGAALGWAGGGRGHTHPSLG